MGRIRTAATAIEAYASDFKRFPNASTPDELAKQISPTYLRLDTPVFIDEWGRPLRYECWKEDPKAPGCDHYAVASAGADGKFDPKPLRNAQPGTISDPDEDIVYRDGHFVRYPE
jgi:hypothetical protein